MLSFTVSNRICQARLGDALTVHQHLPLKGEADQLHGGYHDGDAQLLLPNALVTDILLVGHCHDVHLVNNVKSQDWLIGDKM